MSAELDVLLERLLRNELGHVPVPWPATVYRAVDRMARAAGLDAAAWLRRQALSRDLASLDGLVAAATVPHTTFFRHPDQLDFLRGTVLPKLARSRGGPLRLWSAGCATGEEAYTLALAAEDAGVEAQILATDVSEDALRTARAGVYGGRRVRDLPHARGAERWEAPARLKERVTFHRASLAGPDPAIGWSPLDVIFCRNVLIYFDADGARRLLSALRKLLGHDGWLVIGPAEAVVHPEGVYADPLAPLGFFRRRPISRPITRLEIPETVSSAPPPPRVEPPAPAPPSRLEQGARLLGTGDLEGAEAVLHDLLNDRPDDGPAWFLLGELLLQRGERVQAKTAFLRAARCAPADADDVDAATLARAAERRAEMC